MGLFSMSNHLCFLWMLNCVWLCDPGDYSPPGSSVHRIFHARILEWVAISFSRELSWSRNRTHVSCVTCIDRQIFFFFFFLALHHLVNANRNQNEERVTDQKNTHIQKNPTLTIIYLTLCLWVMPTSSASWILVYSKVMLLFLVFDVFLTWVCR